MSQESSVETERVVVQTYVPKYQRENWDGWADELDMNRSEFIRTMVQAGRRVYVDDSVGGGAASMAPGDDEAADPTDGTVDSDADSLIETVRELLAEEGCLDWDELLTAVSGDIETRLEDALEALQAENHVKYSGREGGYVLQEESQ